MPYSGLIDGYASQQQVLEKKIWDTEERGEALVIDLETTQNRLRDLESSRMDAQSLREEVQRQQALMQTGAREESRGFYDHRFILLLPLGVAIGCYFLRDWLVL